MRRKNSSSKKRRILSDLFQILAVRTSRFLVFCSAAPCPSGLQMEGSAAQPGPFSLILPFVPHLMGHTFTGPSATFRTWNRLFWLLFWPLTHSFPVSSQNQDSVELEVLFQVGLLPDPHGDQSEHNNQTVESTRRPAPGEEPGCWPGRLPLLPRSTSSQSGLWCGCHGDGCFLAGGAVLLQCFRDTQTVEMLTEGVEYSSCLRGADVY